MKLLIAREAQFLALPATVSRERLLAALAMVESAGGRDRRFRFEGAYYVDGFYFKRSPEMQERYNRWQLGIQKSMLEVAGRLTACSFGPWQVLYTVAAELGFDGPPWELADPKVNLHFAIKLINQRHAHHVQEMGEEQAVTLLARAYNAGSVKSKTIPEKYMSRAWANYSDPELFEKLVVLSAYQR